MLTPAQTHDVLVSIMSDVEEQILIGFEFVLANAAHLVGGVELHQNELK